jgi:dTDP-4-dehydrorhamnose reductase
MGKPLLVITGRNGQLGWELEKISHRFADSFDFLFTSRDQLDLGKPETITPFFQRYQPAYFINCAAYTAVDKAETEKETAFAINAVAVGEIAKACFQYNTTLITLSTDYVFNGKGTVPYLPEMNTEPVNYYGYSKKEGEQLALKNNPKTIIIRTSWVYSEHGSNFVKTMLRLMKERTELKVVDDQIGSPTYAADLAMTIFNMIQSLEKGTIHYGIYHYSNAGIISWYQFALRIKDLSGSGCNVMPQPSSAYPTPAKRPFYSVMDTRSIQKDFGVEILDWDSSLQKCLQLIKG